MPRLFLVPFQLSLPGMGTLKQQRPARISPDKLRDIRSGEEWMRAVCAYLRSTARDYQESAGLITYLLHSPALWDSPKQIARDQAAQLELDIMRGSVPIPLTLKEKQLAKKTRAALVAELLRDPLYTDGRLLSRLPKRKLARMVTQSRERLAAAGAAAERRRA